MSKYQIFLLSIIICFTFNINAQKDTIFIKNASFEGEPDPVVPPDFWEDCNFKYESPISTMPGFFGEEKKAIDGETYLGMSIRDNGTWESTFQVLETPLKKGKTYHFSIYLSGSDVFESYSYISALPRIFDDPIILKIWGSDSLCVRSQLLAVSPVINSPEWKKYHFYFTCDKDFPNLTLEAYYAPRNINANSILFLDNMSNITEVEPRKEKNNSEIDKTSFKNDYIDINRFLSIFSPDYIALSPKNGRHRAFNYLYEIANVLKNKNAKLIIGIKLDKKGRMKSEDYNSLEMIKSALLLFGVIEDEEYQVLIQEKKVFKKLDWTYEIGNFGFEIVERK